MYLEKVNLKKQMLDNHGKEQSGDMILCFRPRSVNALDPLFLDIILMGQLIK